MNLHKFVLFLILFLFFQQTEAQNFQPKFVETELSAIFFDTTNFKIPETLNNPNAVPLFPFLEEPQKKMLPKDWLTFKKAFLALELPKEYEYFYLNTKSFTLWNKKHNEEKTFAVNTPNFNPFQPIQSLYNIFSKEQKELRKYNALLQKDYIDSIIGEKCPVKLVKLVTGEVSDSIVYAFFDFCNFNQKQVEDATSYDLIVLVQDKWASFIAKKEEDSVTNAIYLTR